MNTTESNRDLCAVILAGGDGLRLSSLTYRVAGKQIPKQFCPLLGRATLLEDTIHRVSLALPSRAIITSLLVATKASINRRGRAYRLRRCSFSPQTGELERRWSMLCSSCAEINPAAMVAVFPSDHYVSDDGAFMRYVALAVQAVSSFPSTIVLLGAEPTGPEVDYGWIEAAEPLTPAEQTFRIRRIRQFWEQP